MRALAAIVTGTVVLVGLLGVAPVVVAAGVVHGASGVTAGGVTGESGAIVRPVAVARSYRRSSGRGAMTIKVGRIAVEWALAQVGTPYLWGGEAPQVGFDCSGLVQAAYRVAGVTLPRVAQAQFDAGPYLAHGSPLKPGDLVFFGGGPAAVGHVGIYVGSVRGRAWMVDAPHSGADVRVEPFPAVVGNSWGSDTYVGATRPGAGT